MYLYAPGVKSTHVVITLHTAVHDGRVALLGDALLGHAVVDPVGITPHAGVNLAKFDRRAGVLGDGLLEGRVEVAIVEEDIRIMIPAIEVSLDGFDRLNHPLELLVPRQDDERGVRSRPIGFGLETARHKNLVILFADFSAHSLSSAARIMNRDTKMVGTYRIAGGAPAGIKMPPGVAGCRTMRTKMSTMTMHGKRRTAPRGTEMEELPFKRTRRRKKANRGEMRSFCWERSWREGRFGAEGMRLTIFCTRSMMAGDEQPAASPSRAQRQRRQRPGLESTKET